MTKIRKIIFLISMFSGVCIYPQTEKEVNDAMLKAAKYMVEEVSVNGGYVWHYLPDLSRRWGEMEAYKTMVWVQGPGTVDMGQTFLDAYDVTNNEYYYLAAEAATKALVWGQNFDGGWNYMIDFGGDRSLEKWYSTIGTNAWRLEEFQHYYGNSTYDDDVTSGAARLVLRMYLEKLDPTFKQSLEKSIKMVMDSQYPLGGWPQRYPLRYDFGKDGNPDYTSYYTYNDDVIWENVNFLIQCYETLGEKRFLDPIMRGMNFYIISQEGNGSWAEQYDLNLKPAGARTYEPKALRPRTTYSNAMLLLKFYELTGERKFLSGVPKAIEWLERVRLPKSMAENGKYSHSTFVDIQTDKPIFVHRRGSNDKYGEYYTDSSDKNLLKHYGGKGKLDIDELKNEYKRISELTPEEVKMSSPLTPAEYKGASTPQKDYYYYPSLARSSKSRKEINAQEIINSLDSSNRWLVKHRQTSNPYIGDGQNKELTSKYASTDVGDETDTSPYTDTSDQLYISCGEFIKNMRLLMDYIESIKKTDQ